MPALYHYVNYQHNLVLPGQEINHTANNEIILIFAASDYKIFQIWSCLESHTIRFCCATEIHCKQHGTQLPSNHS